MSSLGPPTPLLGEMLIAEGLITPDQLKAALLEQKKIGLTLGEVLIKMGFVDKESVFLPILSKQMNVAWVNLRNVVPTPEALGKLPAKAANYYQALPLSFDNGILKVACQNPTHLRMRDDLTAITKCKVELVLASDKEIIEALKVYYGVGAAMIEQMMVDNPSEKAINTISEGMDEAAAEASISQFLNQILLEAHRAHASDIHIEPFWDELKIRYRIDGVLYDANPPDNIRFFKDALSSRIKILSNLNIAEKRLPQDGRFKLKVEGTDLDLRVSFLPTPLGESIVIRLLTSTRLYSFQELGFTQGQQDQIDHLINKPHGIIFLTGPTGSGKTTTLYTCLSAVNKGDTKIVTIEDPIEYQVKGIIQVQTNSPIGLTFASALRAMLRHDPDVIMVGEVRDVETARISIQSALTGHLVFSTLHTNDAATSVTRLMDMNIEPYLIASSVECFIAQRLVRLVCPQCKFTVEVTPSMREVFNLGQEPITTPIYESKGCPACRMTGYVSRAVIAEILPITDKVRELIIQRATSIKIKEQAIKDGMITLKVSGWHKVLLGLTTPSEVLRVTQTDT